MVSDFREEQKKEQKKDIEELKLRANRLFSSEDGRFVARRMFKVSRLFENDRGTLTDKQLAYISAWQDFVNLFITNLVSKNVLLDILDTERNK